jgi:acyl-CoA reductase-like NAD-dependent aldehyde dehydrogenase
MTLPFERLSPATPPRPDCQDTPVLPILQTTCANHVNCKSNPLESWTPIHQLQPVKQTSQHHPKISTTAKMSSTNEPLPLWIDGKEVTTSATYDVFSPSTGDKLWTSYGATAKEATEAVESSQRAFKTWRKTKPAERRKILLKAADIIEARAAELVDYMKQETGALDGFSNFNIGTTVEVFRNIAGLVSNISGVIPQTQAPGTGAFVFKEPYGVIYGMAPWNAPYILGARAFLYAIAAGNTVVFKGSELSPRTAWALGSVMHEAGLPAGVLNVIYHRPEDAVSVSNTIIEHPAVKKINFTGSTAVGSILSS